MKYRTIQIKSQSKFDIKSASFNIATFNSFIFFAFFLELNFRFIGTGTDLGKLFTTFDVIPTGTVDIYSVENVFIFIFTFINVVINKKK